MTLESYSDYVSNIATRQRKFISSLNLKERLLVLLPNQFNAFTIEIIVTAIYNNERCDLKSFESKFDSQPED